MIFYPDIYFWCVSWGFRDYSIKPKLKVLLEGFQSLEMDLESPTCFFADDSVLFCQAKELEYQVILDILSIYEKESGQKINKDKTNIFFSSNTQPDLQTSIHRF